MKLNIIILALLTFLLSNCSFIFQKSPAPGAQPSIVNTAIGPLTLPPPYATKSAIKLSNGKDWEDGQTPTAPDGFTVTKYAEELDNPRWVYVGQNDDIFVAESNTRFSANRISLLRKNEKGELTRSTFKEDLNQPLGMLILGDFFYIANTNSVMRYPYQTGDKTLGGPGEKILSLPGDGYNNHWTRNLLASKDGNKIYVSVGSASNVGEHGMEEEQRRAAILEINPDGSGEKIFATGLRNPVGMDWNPVNGELWTAVNERDKLGDELVPDYATSVKEGGFYGWPYSYYGALPDPRWSEDPHTEMAKSALIPDVPLGSHTASLGLAFYTADSFPQTYKNGAFIGQHGSWNRSELAGYKVVFIPFKNGKPQPPQDFLTGFIEDEGDNDVFGRPVGVAQMNDGSLLVVDDKSNVIWQVSYSGS